ncbi:hypothetical protein PR003_g29600 [Phytophthora rubi]|uniref:RxLR effector protein n=1 Tax=Phytophthora rubi TaxID=129364 RepID=A0A6A3II24_9STRA|nr:hypothetical protein PR002_g23882 [Phytophthora rubi]KAE8984874.1 hypothetical protein PR001_g23057 [Phytophthora rubi]KAE9274468.1 hypothetical protein PR003_g29600 [Phytophthora rubi]
MRLYCFTLVSTVALLAAVSANPVQAEISNTIDGETRNLRSQNLLEWPESLEEYVENHHHIREIFARWCLEDKEPEDIMKAAETEGDKKAALLYKKYVAMHSEHGRKLSVPECNV